MTTSAVPSPPPPYDATVAARPAAPAASPAACPSCDTPLHGPFCHACGEQAVGRSTTLGGFVRQAAHEVGDVDSKTVLTFRTLFLRPGALTTEYMAGRTRAYLSPFKLYASVFAALMFAYTVYAPMRVTDVGRMLQVDKRPKMLAPLLPMLARRHVTLEQFLARWSDLWLAYQNWLQPVNALLIAIVVAVLYRRSRRPMLEHTVFALHTLAFSFAVSLLLWPAFYAVGLELSAGYAVVAGAAFVSYVVYFYLAARRVYAQSRRKTALKAVLFILGYQTMLGGIEMLSLVASGIHAMARSR